MSLVLYTNRNGHAREKHPQFHVSSIRPRLQLRNCTCSALSRVRRWVVSLLSWSPLLSSTTLLAWRLAERAVILGLKVQSGSCNPAAFTSKFNVGATFVRLVCGLAAYGLGLRSALFFLHPCASAVGWN